MPSGDNLSPEGSLCCKCRQKGPSGDAGRRGECDAGGDGAGAKKCEKRDGANL